MYKPAPPRPKKTNITRTRSGCKICRKRRKKCDEIKPSCSTCIRLGKRCEYFQTKFEFKEIIVTPSPEQCTSDSSSHNVSTNHNAQASINTVFQHTISPSPDDSIEISHHIFEFSRPELTGLPNRLPGDIHGGRCNEYLSGIIPPSASCFDGDDIVHNFLDGCDQHLVSNRFPIANCSEDLMAEDIDLSTSRIRTSNLSTILCLQTWDQGRITELEANRPHHQFVALAQSKEFPIATADESSSVAIASLPRALNLHSGSNQDILYMNLWDTQCIPALHPVFQRFSILDTLTPATIDTIMALSACRISRILPQKKAFINSDIPGLAFRPDTSHQALSQKYYRSAMRRVASWVSTDGKSNLSATLSVLVLFCYLESSMGNFSEFAVHSGGITTLTQMQAHGEIRSDSYEAELIAAWLQARMQNWWRRFYFSTPEFQTSPLPVSLLPGLEMTLANMDNRRVSVLLILCESLSLSSVELIRLWKSSQHTQSCLDCDAIGNLNFEDKDNSRLESYKDSMHKQAKALSDWHAHVPLSELPIESFQDTRRPLSSEDGTLAVHPLCFQSHYAAMNYAYFVSAHIIQCAGLAQRSQFNASEVSEQFSDDFEFWVSILLRIAAGMDWEECVRTNIYTIGFSGLLFACAVRSRSLSVGLWIQDWLEERQRIDGFEEGSFPVLQILQVLRVINQERKNGYDILGIFQPVDDGGGGGKLDSYHSQRLTSILVYERCQNTGSLLSKRVSI